MIDYIEISLKSFESKLIQNAVLQILSLLPSQWQFSQFSLPMTKKRFTVLRSPHIDKKSREQFEIQYYKNIIRFIIPKHENALTNEDYTKYNSSGVDSVLLNNVNSKSSFNEIKVQLDSTENLAQNFQLSFFQLFIENLKRIKFLGVQMKIRIVYTTFLGK